MVTKFWCRLFISKAGDWSCHLLIKNQMKSPKELQPEVDFCYLCAIYVNPGFQFMKEQCASLGAFIKHGQGLFQCKTLKLRARPLISCVLWLRFKSLYFSWERSDLRALTSVCELRVVVMCQGFMVSVRRASSIVSNILKYSNHSLLSLVDLEQLTINRPLLLFVLFSQWKCQANLHLCLFINHAVIQEAEWSSS